MNRSQAAATFSFPTRLWLLRRALPRHDPARLIIDRLFPDLRRNFHRLSVAQNFEFDFFVQLDLRNQIAQLRKTFHVTAIELANNVPFLQLRFGRRRSWHDFIDNRALGFSVTLARLKRARQEAEIAANDSALFQQTLERS